jgi:hypothetical protein
MDGGSENKLLTKALLEDYMIKRIVVSAYHPQANGLVKCGYQAIVNSLSKYCSNQSTNWVQYLPLALALGADRISTRRATGFSAFELLYGHDYLLPIELSLESWSAADWEGEVIIRQDLIVAPMRELDQRTLREAQASENLKNSHLANKAQFDNVKRLQVTPQQLKVGDLVLFHNTILKHSHSRKHDMDLIRYTKSLKILQIICWKNWVVHPLLPVFRKSA